MPVTRIERPFGSATLVLETGKLAKQAHGAVVTQLGETVVLTAATAGGAIPGRDFGTGRPARTGPTQSATNRRHFTRIAGTTEPGPTMIL